MAHWARRRSSVRKRASRRTRSPRSTRRSAGSPRSRNARWGAKSRGSPARGAAGGLGFALQLVGGSFASGAEVVAGLIGLDGALADADWAITGEGRSDRQTLLAKAPYVVALHAAAHAVPVTLISGAVDAAALPELAAHFAGCFGLPNGPATLADCIGDAAALLEARAEQAARVFAAGRRIPHRTVE